MSTDYHTAQGDFSSIVYRLQPMVLSNFVMWLDLKVAEFKVYGQMLLDEQDTNCSKWFLRTGLGQDVPPHAKQKERTSNVHVGTTERPKRSSTSVVSKPAKQTRIDISDEEENIEFKTKSILPLEASGMLEEFNQFQEQMNSFISSAANQAVQNSSPATQLFGRTKTLPSRQSPIQQQEKKHSEHDVPKHIVVKKTLSPVFDIIQSHSADSSLSSDLSNLSRPTSEASSQRPLPVLSQTSQFETPHSQQLPTAVSSSTILPQSDSKPVVKVEPTDSEYDESAMDRIAPFSEMSSENTPSSMYLVPNVAMTGDTNSNVSGQTRTVTHSDGIMYFSTQSDSEALQTDDKSAVFCDSILNTSDNTSTGVMKYNNLPFDCDWMSVKHGQLNSHYHPQLSGHVSPEDGCDTAMRGDLSYSEGYSIQGFQKIDPRTYLCEFCTYVACQKTDLMRHKQLRHAAADGSDLPLSVEQNEHRKVRGFSRQWKKEDMEQAVTFYRNQQVVGYKVSIRQLAEQFNVPKSTLSYQILSQSRSNQTNVQL